ncbi:MAG: enoyl-CoA hydratase [Anaerolineae bacterium SM23_ 63]|nr:MAG: enoyl-CoA hydratase [Anaerolineae bacterium SM23_ 63]HEY46084.1 enoyl-CoA hydratase/isomerase family protein [Anaerolineae bacterium]
MTEFQHWLFRSRGHIATLSLNRPEESNSLILEMFQELGEITNRLRVDKDIWVVIVEGKGKHFSIGVDLSVIQSIIDYPEGPFRENLLAMQQCLDSFEALEKPTIAKVHGFCLGGGLILALCCDFRIASKRTVLGLPEVKRGVAVIAGTQRVTRVVGVAVAKEMILLCRNLNASMAKEYGLVHKVVPPEELDQAAMSLAKKFLKLPPRTVGGAKRIINDGASLTLRASQELEIDVQAELIDSPDFKEAISSYLEDRPPSFVGE